MLLHIRKLANTHAYAVLLPCYFALSACATLAPAFGGNHGDDAIGEAANYVDSFPQINISELARNSAVDVIKVGDTAEVTIYNVEDLSGNYIVDRTGNISMPLIGPVQAEGRSVFELQEALTRRYGADYLQNPNINVKLDAKKLGKVIVDGAVNKPGVFEVDRVIRLSEAIALAEGIGEDTTGKSVYIVRNVGGTAKVKEVNLRNIRNLSAPDPEISPDDVIFVNDSAGRVIFREFLRTVPLLNTAIIYGTR